MPLQSSFDPTTSLKSSFYSPEELAEISMANEAQRLEDRGVIGRGLTRGMYQTGSLLNNALGGLTEPFAPQYSQTAFNDALGYDQLAQRQIAPSDVLSYDKVDGLGSAARYIGGAFAENLPNALLTLPAGLGAGVALRGSALSPMARIVAGSMAGAAPLQFGEGIQTMRQDPNILATTTPTERLGYGAGYAALTAPMEGLGEGMLAARAAGAGSKALKNVFKDGLSATLKDSAAHVAKAVPESMLTEGATEALQQATQQGLKTHLNPERDKSKDEHELIDSFLKGWAAGAPTSIVGRGADAAWAQGRGATDALKGLLRDKILPDHLKDRPDNELLDWDNADNEQRNSWASQLADSIMSGDAPQNLKDSAAKFYERMRSGVKDAWTSLSEPLMEDERVARARAGVERFINAAKKANDNTFGKANAEASEFDQDLYMQFGEYLDPKGASARDTELKSNLFNTVKQALIDDNWADLPITELEDEFGTIGRATAAITKLRENMVRAGMVEHDDEFGKLLEATALDGQRGERAKMDVIARYGRSYIKGKPKDAELKAVSRGLTDILSKWSSLSDTQKAAFEKQMKKEFGANAEKVIEAHKPKTIADTEVDLSEDSGNREVSPSKQRFIGQATQHSRKVASGGQQQNTIEDHGGFFRLDHPDKQTRDSIKRAFNDAQADLRKDGYFVKPMSPLEYHEATGISKSTIRRHLGYKTIAELETSNAKILAVEPRSEDALYYDKDDTSLDHDDIKALSERTERSLSTIPESFPIEDKVLLGKISKALKQGKGSRAAMRELGFEHGVKLRPAGGKVYLHNNPRHGGNGIFTVHMKDGTKYDISAQHLISQMRERGKGTLTDRSAYRMFLSGIAAIQNNENVEKITANNLWGETDEHPFAMAPGVTNHFQLEKGLNLSWAHKRSQAYEKSLNQPTNLDAAVEELNDVNEQLAEDPENEELLERQAELEETVARLQAEQDQYEGEGERHEPGEVRTSDDITSLEAQESGLGPRTNDELTGEVLHPYGKLMRTGDRENVTFNGVPLRLRSGVGAKNIVGTIRKVVAVAKQLSFTPDKAMDMVARAAAAQKDGNRKAFTILSNLAAYEMGEAILERMADLQEQGKAEGRKEWAQLRDAWASEPTLLKSYEEGKEYAQLIEQAKADLAEAKTTENKKAIEKAKNILDGLVDPITAYMPYDARKGIKATKRHDFDNAADRASYRSEFIATIEYKSDAEIKAEMEAREQRIERYKGYTQTDNVQQLIKMMEQEQAASQRLLDKRASGERTQKTEAIKVKEDKRVYKGLSNKEDPFEKARKDLQGRKDSAQAAADDLSARAKADEALMALADEVEQVVEEEIKAAVGKVVGKHPKAQLTKNLRRLGNALVNAAKALYQSAKDGKLNKNELIAELRKALRAFKQVVGGVARELDKLVSELIATYRASDYNHNTLINAARGWASKLQALVSASPEVSAEEGAKRQKLIKRLAAKFEGRFKSGTETMEHESGLSSLGKFSTRMFESQGQLVFVAVPDSLLNSFATQFSEKHGISMEQAKQIVEVSISQAPESLLPLAPFISTYNLSTGYFMVGSAIPGSPAESLMREAGVLSQTTGVSGKVWNKLDGLGNASLYNLLGEFAARIQSHLGTDDFHMNWNRDTGGAASRGKGKKNDIKFNAEATVMHSEGAGAQYDLDDPNVQRLVDDFNHVLHGETVDYHMISDAKYRTLISSGLLFKYNIAQQYELKNDGARAALGVIKTFLKSRGFDVGSTQFVIHGDHSKASGIYDPINNIISYSKTTVAHLMSDDLTVEKVEAISTLLHEAAHRLDLSAHIGDEAMPVSQFNDALGEDGAMRAEIEALHENKVFGEFFSYPLDYNYQGSAMVAELFAQAYALYHVVGDSLKQHAPTLFRYLKEVENAKTLADKRAAIANSGLSGEEFDSGMVKHLGDQGFKYKTLERRGTGEYRKGGERDVYANNAEGSYASGKGVSQAEFDEAKDYIAKVLGPKVITQLVKDLGGNSAAWNRKGGDTIIRIAMHAANPLSKAHHEAMHEFFQRLLDSGSPAADILRTAANSKIVQRQIEQFFHKDANYAKIKQAIANDEHERVAYMFQLWVAGKLNLGPQTQSVFKKVVNFLRKTFGFLTADQKAEVVMQYFHDGKMSEPNLVAEVLSKDPRFQTEFQNKVLDAANPIMRAIREVTFTAQNVLIESGNKGFEKIGRLFSTETGRRNEDISFFDAKMQKTNQYNDHLFNLIRGADEKDLAAAVEGLQTGVVSKDAKIAKLQGSIHKMLEHIYQYMTDAGVKIRHQKDYFPRSWDFTKIAENRAKFEQMLIDEHLKTTGKPLSAGVATGIVNTIIENRGADPLNEDELFAGYTPFMAAANKRVLSFIKSPEFAEYQHNDLREIMTTYIAQAVHKAEYTRRFGHNGSELRKMIIEAVGEEVGAAEWGKARKAAQDKLDAERKRLEALHPKDKGKVLEELTKLGYHKGELQISQIAAEITDKEARTKFADYEPQLRQNVRAIMAMEGTLGADINPNLRKWQAALIVYENMRLLGMSLFSQVIDPLGVLVRGGSLNDAWNTFKKGLAGTWAGWRGHPLEDSASKLAMRLGIIDAGAYMNSQGNAYSSIFLGKTAKKWNDRLFRWNGVEGFSQGTRVGAMEAAIAFIKAHSTLPTEHSERWLSELNLKASDIKLDAKGELDYSDPKIQQAIFRWVEGAILRPNAAMRPSWSSDPHFALIFHLKQFTYAMQKVLLERVANEAKHGNYDPAITMILTYVPAMMAADFLRGIAAHGGEEPPWKRRWTFGDYLADGVQRAGLFGVPQLALDAAKWGPTELAGPAVEQVNRIGKTFLREIERDIELDVKAAASGNIGDLERARDFNGVAHAAKKSLRDALPINSLTKRYVYDEVVGK